MTSTAAGSPAARAEIGRWAREHGVTWEVHTLARGEQGHVHAVGHEIQLTCAAPDLDPGCARCRRVYEHVHELAELAIAVAQAQEIARVRSFEPMLRFRPTTGELQPEIEVAIEVARPQGAPGVTEEEARCTVQLEKSLTALGVRKH